MEKVKKKKKKKKKKNMPTFEICLCGRAHRSTEQRMLNAKWRTKNTLCRKKCCCIVECRGNAAKRTAPGMSPAALHKKLATITTDQRTHNISTCGCAVGKNPRTFFANLSRASRGNTLSPCNDTNLKSVRPCVVPLCSKAGSSTTTEQRSTMR